MLTDYIETNNISAQILTFDEEVSSSTRATALERTLPGVKTILFAHSKGFTLVILEGSKKVNVRALGEVEDTSHVRLATPEEVIEVTGYAVGGVPPISIYGTRTLIDEGVLAHAWVCGGGGDSFSLVKIQVKDILAHAFDVKVVKIALESARKKE